MTLPPTGSPDLATLDIVGLRRLFHSRPETAFTELWTSAVIAAELGRLGYAVSSGRTAINLTLTRGLPSDGEWALATERATAWGLSPAEASGATPRHTAVVAELEGDRSGPTVAFRFDIDALPLSEAELPEHRPYRDGFISTAAGAMHACGHDGHIAIGLELARRLADRDFPGRVRLLFQPAEEGGRGASAMLCAGVLDDVDQFFALHLGLGLPVGTVAAETVDFFATSKLEVAFSGVQAHAAAAPEHGRHALLAAATATLGLHALPRFATADTRVNVGRLCGGTSPNIVPAHAEMLLELRATSGAVCDELDNRARRVLRAAGDAYGVGVEVRPLGSATTASCDAAAVGRVAAAARAAAGVTDVRTGHPAGVSDDATWLMRAAQDAGGIATYFVVGASSPAPHHNPLFDVDERAVAIAAEIVETLAHQADTMPPETSAPTPH